MHFREGEMQEHDRSRVDMRLESSRMCSEHSRTELTQVTRDLAATDIGL